MDFLLDGSSSYGGIDHAAANHQNWSKPSNESGRAWLDQTLGKDTRTPVVGPYIPQVLQASHSEATWQSLQVDDMKIGITPTYGGSYSLERDFIHPFPRRQPEGQLTSIHGLLTPMIHPNRLTAVSAIHSDPTNMNPLARIADAEQLPSGWLICTGTEEIGDVHRDQTGSGETVGPSSLTIGSSLNAMTSFNQIQRIHEDSVRREIEHSLSTLFDLSPILTPAEALSPTFIVKNGSRYICGICSKSHARPSRAIACENDHLGYQPFVCDGTCGHPAW
ncbi:hypothetical protein FRC19_003042 [Serendipita sp. 401]|nr:hypothetical protein FRC19_003042 [Serendipita sp. 401]